MEHQNRLAQELEQGRSRLRKLIRKAILRRRMPFFQRLITQDKGWALYVMVVKKHIERCKKKKLTTNYAKASDEQKKLLEQMDIELATMENLIELPARAVKHALLAEHTKAERNVVQEITSDIEEEQNARGIGAGT